MTALPMDDRASQTLAAAEEVSSLLNENGISNAVIGAVAMALHGYSRATTDLDLATAADPFTKMQQVAKIISAQGNDTDMATPNAEDPLGGVLNVRRDDIDLIQIVNFYNPFSPGKAELAKETIATATKARGVALAIADVPHLVILKLYANDQQSQRDIVELLKANPNIDVGALRKLAQKFDLAEALDDLLN